MPQELRDKVSQFGWAKDEFVDNDNFPTQLYVREARRMIGEYVMTQKNCEGYESVEDAVGLAAYIMDSHNCQRIVIDGMVKNEGDVQSGGFPPYPISYRSITPKRNECINLTVPVCVSASHIAYGSIRMEPVFMVLAQSAAVASIMALDENIAVQEVDVNKLNKVLQENPYLDGTIAEILLDDNDQMNIITEGDWAKIDGYYYKSSYTKANSKRGSLKVKANVEKAGKYEVMFYCSSSIAESDLPIAMNVSIGNNEKEYVVIATPLEHVGRWNNLGVYDLQPGDIALTIDANVKTGSAFFDAVILNPIK